MATYTTQTVITPEDLSTAADPDEVINRAEQTVRTTLAGTFAEPEGGEWRIGWLARSAAGTAPWDPRADDVPDLAEYLICRGRRTV